jgi:hypothetical protein
MRTLLALIGIASAIAGAGLLTASQADGARTSPVARTALERSVFHDQSSVGAVARPPFVVTKVRCIEAGEFCNVTRQTTTRRFTLVELLRVRVQREPGSRQWSYRGVDEAANTALDSARDGHLIWAISATTPVRS